MCVNANEIFTIHTGTKPSTLVLLLFQKKCTKPFVNLQAVQSLSLAPFPTKLNLAFLQTDLQNGLSSTEKYCN